RCSGEVRRPRHNWKLLPRRGEVRVVTIDPAVLDERVAEAVSFLARVLPRHIAGLRQQPQGGHREFRLQNPHHPDRPLGISTEGGEVTLWFGECHDHFASLATPSSGDGVASEADLVSEMVVKVVLLVSGAERSYSAWAGDGCLGGGWLQAGAEAREAFAHFPPADRLQVVGWCPSDDAEVRRGGAGSGPESPGLKA